MKNKILKCYYYINYNKKTKVVFLKMVLIKSNNELVYVYKKKFSSQLINHDLSGLLYVLKALKKAFLEGDFAYEDSLVIYANRLPLLQHNYYKANNEKVYIEVQLILEYFKNWSIKVSGYSFAIIKKYSNSIKHYYKKVDKINQYSRNHCVNKLKHSLLRVCDFLQNPEYQLIFFDVEMNCNDRNTGEEGGFEVIAIGAVKVFNNLINYEDTFYSTIKPRKNPTLSKFCKEITNLSQEAINNSRDFKVVMKDFDKWVGGRKTIFISWGREDIRALKRDNKNNGTRLQIVNQIRNRHIDFQKEFCTYKLKSKNLISLTKAINLYNLSFYGIQHDPKDDAINTARVYLKSID